MSQVYRYFVLAVVVIALSVDSSAGSLTCDEELVSLAGKYQQAAQKVEQLATRCRDEVNGVKAKEIKLLLRSRQLNTELHQAERTGGTKKEIRALRKKLAAVDKQLKEVQSKKRTICKQQVATAKKELGAIRESLKRAEKEL